MFLGFVTFFSGPVLNRLFLFTSPILFIDITHLKTNLWLLHFQNIP